MTSSVNVKRKLGEQEELKELKKRLTDLRKEREELEQNIILIRSMINLLK